MIKLAAKHDIDALKGFARTMIWAFPVVFMGILPWIFEQPIHWWPLVISALLAILYVVYPAGLYVPYRIWMAIALVLGWINTRLILGFAFYLLILPIGLLMRSLGKLQYQPRRGKTSLTLYINRPEPTKKEQLEDPF